MAKISGQKDFTKVTLPQVIITQLFVDANEIQEKLGLSGNTLQTLRREGTLIQGLHFSEINSRLILYNLPLMIDWVANRHDPAAHLLAIEHFQANLLSNRPRPRGRKKTMRSTAV